MTQSTRVTRLNSYVWHDSLVCVTWLTHILLLHLYSCGYCWVHSYVWHDSVYTCMSWLNSCVWRDSSTWLHSCVQRDSSVQMWHDSIYMCGITCMTQFICVASLICTDVAWLDSYLWHDSVYKCNMTQFMCVTWLVEMFRQMSWSPWRQHVYVRTCDIAQFTRVTDPIHICNITLNWYVWRDSIRFCDMTLSSYAWHDACHVYTWHDSLMRAGSGRGARDCGA